MSRITQNAIGFVKRITLTLTLTVLMLFQAVAADAAQPVPELQQQEQFTRAWQAASRGQRDDFHQLMQGLVDYVLYPYLQYEDLRHRRGSVKTAEMAAFLDAHQDWPFTAGLHSGLAENPG